MQLITWIKTRLSKLNREMPRWRRRDLSQGKKKIKKHNGSWSISRAQAAAA